MQPTTNIPVQYSSVSAATQQFISPATHIHKVITHTSMLIASQPTNDLPENYSYSFAQGRES